MSFEERSEEEFQDDVRDSVSESIRQNHERILQVHYKDVLSYLKRAWWTSARAEVDGSSESLDSSEELPVGLSDSSV